MNAGDQAIEDIRAVRHQISAEHGHDIKKYLTALREEEKLHAAQIKRGEELLARRKADRIKFPEIAIETLSLHEPRPKDKE